VYKVLAGKPEGKRPIGRPRRRWEQNESLQDWLGDVEWIRLAQDRNWWRALAKAVMNFRVLAPRSYLEKEPYDYERGSS
jgi:hypothetical protein